MTKAGRPKRATLRDVARNAQVSVATVSRVLNNSDLVTKDTRDRVQNAIEALSFVPSAAARTLNTGRSRTIGALVPTLDHSIFARYLNALEDQLSDHGYALIVAVTDGDEEVEERKARILLDLGVEGLIISGKAHTAGFDALVERFQIPTLITSFYDRNARYPTVGYDNAAIAERALRFLSEHGHGSVGVVHGPTDVNDRISARIDGVMQASSTISVSLWPTSMDVRGGADAVARMIAANACPSAILCLSDVQALGALFELQRQGVAVPGQVALMGFDNLEWSAVSSPSITSINLNADHMGFEAANAMANWIVSGNRPAAAALRAEIIVRDST